MKINDPLGVTSRIDDKNVLLLKLFTSERVKIIIILEEAKHV